MDFTINNQQKQNLFFWYNIIVKEKQMKNKTLQRVYKMLKPQTKAIIIISILSIIINIGEVIKPYLIKIVMDDYLSSGLWQKGIISIGIIGSIYIAIVLIGNILDFIVTTSTSMMGENVIYSIRNKLYKYIQYTNIFNILIFLFMIRRHLERCLLELQVM